ncbi:MAG: TolB-like 6-bladed beta-propeller domain-containing protein [Muribaculaceae bacterium]|nr:TolB-like 6-bladed beta-propeller domain-containing protein [Muribaculaceae bacterium]
MKKENLICWATIVCSIVLDGCNNKTGEYAPLQNRDSFIELKGEQILPDAKFLYPQGLIVAGNSLLVQDNDERGFYTVLNIENGDVLGYIGHQGMGPGEFLNMRNVTYSSVDSTLYVHDNILGKGYYFHFLPDRPVISDLNRVSLIDFRAQNSIMVQDTRPISETSVVTNSPAEGNMFSVIDREGRRRYSFGKYPGDNTYISDSITFPMRVQLLMAVSPSYDRFVAAGMHSDWLAFYKVDGDSATLLNEYFSEENQIGIKTLGDEKQIVYSAVYTPETKNYFTDLTSSPSYVYAKYSGNSKADKENGTDKRQCILRFTWDGDFVDGFVLDGQCSCAAVTDDDSRIIGFAAAGEDEVILKEYKLPSPK